MNQMEEFEKNMRKVGGEEQQQHHQHQQQQQDKMTTTTTFDRMPLLSQEFKFKQDINQRYKFQDLLGT